MSLPTSRVASKQKRPAKTLHHVTVQAPPRKARARGKNCDSQILAQNYHTIPKYYCFYMCFWNHPNLCKKKDNHYTLYTSTCTQARTERERESTDLCYQCAEDSKHTQDQQTTQPWTSFPWWSQHPPHTTHLFLGVRWDTQPPTDRHTQYCQCVSQTINIE